MKKCTININLGGNICFFVDLWCRFMEPGSAAETSAQRRPAWQFDVYDQNINKTPAEEGKLSCMYAFQIPVTMFTMGIIVDTHDAHDKPQKFMSQVGHSIGLHGQCLARYAAYVHCCTSQPAIQCLKIFFNISITIFLSICDQISVKKFAPL